MAEYPQLESSPPAIWNESHVANWEEALRQLSIVDAILKKCERCKIPVGELRQECDSCCEFLTNLLNDYKGFDADTPEPLKG